MYFSQQHDILRDSRQTYDNYLLTLMMEIDDLVFATPELLDLWNRLAKLIRNHQQLEAVAFYKAEDNQIRVFNLVGSDIYEKSSFKCAPCLTSFSPFDCEGKDNSMCFDISNVFTQLGITNDEGYIKEVRIDNRCYGWIVFKLDKSRKDNGSNFQLLEWLERLVSRRYQLNSLIGEQQGLRCDLQQLTQKMTHTQSLVRGIFREAPWGVIQVSSGRIRFVNSKIVESTGYDVNVLKSKYLSELLLPGYDSIEKLDQFLAEIDSSGRSDMDMMIRCNNGKPLVYMVKGFTSSDGNGVILFCYDKTDISVVENCLLESEERNRKILEANIDGIFIISRKGCLMYVNQAGCQITGYSRSELPNLDLEVLFPFNNGLEDYFNITSVIRKDLCYHGDSHILHKNGEVRYVEIHGTTISLDEKEHYYFSIHDITRRKRNEAELKLSEQKFRSLSENLPDCILRIAKNGLVTYFNSVSGVLFGDENITIGLLVCNLPFPDSDNIFEIFKRVITTGVMEHIEVEHFSVEEGRNVTLDWAFSPELDDAGECYSVLGIGRNITFRKEAEKNLILAKEKAEAADKLKSIFLANLSHEIRTPLNAIVGFANLLNEPEFDMVEKKEFSEVINKNADNLIWMINEILDYAKMESGHLKIVNSAIDLKEFLLGIFQSYRPKMSLHFKHNVEFRLQKDFDSKQTVKVLADVNRLRQVVTNFFENAIKFVDQGFVELGFEVESNWVKIYVKDTGIGILKENQEFIFEAFRQEEEAPSKKYGGTGLGLAICKRLTEAMGGTIGVVSEKDKGACFFVRLKRFF
jgi:PAS domain S-box-containing protein